MNTRVLPRRAAAVPAAAALVLCALPGVPGAAAAPPEPVGGPRLAETGTIVDAPAGFRAPPKIKAASWVIADADNGQILAAKDPHGKYLPASTLKTLTALTLIPKLDPNRLVRPSQKACDVEGTKVGMTPSMQYKVHDLFNALLMMSANDAAVTLAEANGGMARTIADMNAEARRINARDTLAASPNGLDVDLGLNVHTQHTSSYDLALILREGMKNPDYRAYVRTLTAHFPAPPTKKQRKKGKKVGGYPIYTHNRMLPGQPYAYQGMLGGKNGYTVAAEQTFVAEARRGNHTILISLMKADAPPSEYATKLLNWGFGAVGKVRPVGTLVAPGDAATKAAAAGHGANLPAASLGSAETDRTWWLVGGGAVGVVAALAVLTAVLRRRRPLPSPAPVAAAAPPDPDRIPDETP
ncbi:D-alanyl-D-alanine carboxypeptidase family protein [Actinomadura atramentaria]|uniref:D-alanyl-D-alanine carboxypeptidase family protein n=1 Tax=Actinomadura atramentaria TaxID=1990 RepID=UPI00035EE5D7|nr:D-alanyl-D-alanine carboxypeptidase [Actinomadura atramentaria]